MKSVENRNFFLHISTLDACQGIRLNLLNTLQSRAFSCKLTSCSIHAAKLVQTRVEPCKFPPGFLATSRGVPRKKCTATGQKRRFSTQKSRNVLFFLTKLVFANLHVFLPICTFLHGVGKERPQRDFGAVVPDTETSVPSCNRLSTSTSRPCKVAISLTMASPNPVPPVRLERLFSTR